MDLDLLGYQFCFIAQLKPERNSSGKILKFMPQSRYRNSNGLPLHKHAHGPFCQFRIPMNLPWKGVYVVTVDGDVKYIGECQDLSERFGPRGYGIIHPRNCFQGGQPTNCKINNLVLTYASENRRIELWFRATQERKQIEAESIRRLQPEWNAQLKWLPGLGPLLVATGDQSLSGLGR